MNLASIMDAVATRLDTIEGLRVFAYPPATVQGGGGAFAVVSYPEKINYDQTYGRGLTMVSGLEVVVAVGKPTDRTARDRATRYVSDQDPTSVKVALEAAPAPATWDDLRVVSCDFDVVTIAGIDYLAALFSIDVTCRGHA